MQLYGATTRRTQRGTTAPVVAPQQAAAPKTLRTPVAGGRQLMLQHHGQSPASALAGTVPSPRRSAETATLKEQLEIMKIELAEAKQAKKKVEEALAARSPPALPLQAPIRPVIPVPIVADGLSTEEKAAAYLALCTKFADDTEAYVAADEEYKAATRRADVDAQVDAAVQEAVGKLLAAQTSGSQRQSKAGTFKVMAPHPEVEGDEDDGEIDDDDDEVYEGSSEDGYEPTEPALNRTQVKDQEKFERLMHRRTGAMEASSLDDVERSSPYVLEQYLPGAGLSTFASDLLDPSSSALGVTCFALPGGRGGMKLVAGHGAGKSREHVFYVDVNSQGDAYAAVQVLRGHGAVMKGIRKFCGFQLLLVSQAALDGEVRDRLVLLLREMETQLIGAVKLHAETGLEATATKSQWIYNAAVIASFVVAIFNTLGVIMLERIPDAGDMTKLIKETWRDLYKPLLATEDGIITHLTADELRNSAMIILLGCEECERAGQSTNSCFKCKAKAPRPANTTVAFDTAFKAAKARDGKLERKAFAASAEGHDAEAKDKAARSKLPTAHATTEAGHFQAHLKNQRPIDIPF